jgi:predicted PolB exonuclease-like 3'-5' exonuclease
MIILDIETVAIDGAAALAEEPTPPANYKDAAKIAAWIEERRQKQIDSAALYPWTARIIALGWAEAGEEIAHVETCESESSEQRVLRELWSRVQDVHGHATPIITFAGRTFDLPVLMCRSILLGVPHRPLNLDRYRSPHPDLLQVLTFNGAIDGRTLRWYAKRFGLNTDDAFSGKEIATLYQDGNWDAIRKHCESDVLLTKQIAEVIGLIKRPMRGVL